jgi:hypothetical protein
MSSSATPGRRASLGELRQPQSLLVVASDEEGVGKRRGNVREVTPVSHPLERLASRPQLTLGSGSVPSEQLHVTRLLRDARGEEDLEAKLLCQRLCPHDKVARGIEAALHRLELRACP